uniref:Uncharacterized protein n=1 Tax=Knipowitschia caucasica TaxID=637954 RepID=A0AAV2LTE9_KNICA
MASSSAANVHLLPESGTERSHTSGNESSPESRRFPPKNSAGNVPIFEHGEEEEGPIPAGVCLEQINAELRIYTDLCGGRSKPDVTNHRAAPHAAKPPGQTRGRGEARATS